MNAPQIIVIELRWFVWAVIHGQVWSFDFIIRLGMSRRFFLFADVLNHFFASARSFPAHVRPATAADFHAHDFDRERATGMTEQRVGEPEGEKHQTEYKHMQTE